MEDKKTKIRRAVLQQRDSITPVKRAEKSAVICRELTQLMHELLEKAPKGNRPDFCVSVYHAMKSEVDLCSFIKSAYESGINVCFPCMTKTQNHKGFEPNASKMIMRKVPPANYGHEAVPFLNYPMKAFAFDEPSLDCFPSVRPEMIDLIVVPMVAFDHHKNRLGYGGGNYDAYLSMASAHCVIVGVAFVEQKHSPLPLEPHDFPLPNIITA